MKIMKIKNIKSIGKKRVYDISVTDKEHYVLRNGVITHNTGGIYSADTILFIGKQQEKEGKDIVGWNFILNIEKSRYVKERSKIPILVKYNAGIDKYSGMFDLAVEAGSILNPTKGYYQYPDSESKKVRRSELESDHEVMGEIVDSDEFQQFISNKFKL